MEEFSRRLVCEFVSWSREFAPHHDGGLRLIPGKALFHRRGAQTFFREELPVAEGGVRPIPGKALFHR